MSRDTFSDHWDRCSASTIVLCRVSRVLSSPSTATTNSPSRVRPTAAKSISWVNRTCMGPSSVAIATNPLFSDACAASATDFAESTDRRTPHIASTSATYQVVRCSTAAAVGWACSPPRRGHRRQARRDRSAMSEGERRGPFVRHMILTARTGVLWSRIRESVGPLEAME